MTLQDEVHSNESDLQEIKKIEINNNNNKKSK